MAKALEVLDAVSEDDKAAKAEAYKAAAAAVCLVEVLGAMPAVLQSEAFANDRIVRI